MAARVAKFELSAEKQAQRQADARLDELLNVMVKARDAWHEADEKFTDLAVREIALAIVNGDMKRAGKVLLVCIETADEHFDFLAEDFYEFAVSGDGSEMAETLLSGWEKLEEVLGINEVGNKSPRRNSPRSTSSSPTKSNVVAFRKASDVDGRLR